MAIAGDGGPELLLRSKQGEFFDFSFPGADFTLIRGINDRGDQAGGVLFSLESPPEGFVAFRVRGRGLD